MARLEHVNIAVKDGAGLAQMLVDVFGWHMRWEGPSQNQLGYTRHVGNDDTYVAVYETDEPIRALQGHLGIVVDDLDATQKRVEDAGFTAHHFADYEPGRRFYFMGPQDVEIEVVSYD